MEIEQEQDKPKEKRRNRQGIEFDKSLLIEKSKDDDGRECDKENN